MRIKFVGLLLMAITSTAIAQTTLPYTFAPGTVAKASEVNANFQALLTAINKLEGPATAASVAGTYTLASLGLYMDSTAQAGTSSNTARIEHTATNATATLNANGSFTLSPESTFGAAMTFDFFKNGSNVVTNAQAATQSAAPSPSGGGTWSLSGSTLTLSLNGGGSGTFTAAAGGRLFIGIDASPDNKSQDLHILIRTN